MTSNPFSFIKKFLKKDSSKDEYDEELLNRVFSDQKMAMPAAPSAPVDVNGYRVSYRFSLVIDTKRDVNKAQFFRMLGYVLGHMCANLESSVGLRAVLSCLNEMVESNQLEIMTENKFNRYYGKTVKVKSMNAQRSLYYRILDEKKDLKSPLQYESNYEDSVNFAFEEIGYAKSSFEMEVMACYVGPDSCPKFKTGWPKQPYAASYDATDMFVRTIMAGNSKTAKKLKQVTTVHLMHVEDSSASSIDSEKALAVWKP